MRLDTDHPILLKRWLVFEIERYYPGGGFHDFHSSYDNFEDALTKAKEIDREYTFGQLVDGTTGEIYDLETGKPYAD